MLKRIAATAATALLAVGGLGLALPAAASAAPPTDPSNRSALEGTGPAETGCNAGAYIVKAWDMHNDVYNEDQGLVQLIYSPACGTNWVNVYGFTPGNNYSVKMENTIPGIAAYLGGVTAGDSAATLQTYAPGATCVEVAWRIGNLVTGHAEGEGSSILC